MNPKKIALAFAFLSVAALLPATVAEQGEPTRPERTFSGAYTLALGWSNDLANVQTIALSDGSSVGLMAAVVTCGDSAGLGGACAPTFLDEGEVLELTVADAATPEVRFMACVDGDNDGICRPEFPLDRIYIEPCNDGDNTLTTQHTGKMGTLDVYLLNGVGSPCVPTKGGASGIIRRQPECSDLRDNDGNGAIDYPLDPECDSPFDDTERPPQCRDGRDNDGNRWRDWPQDPGCSSPDDDQEWSPACSNRWDDDGDGLVDWPNDPDCANKNDTSEWPVRFN